jgi:hypothetical protein
MTNELKQELKDNARFCPRSVCFEKAFLEKLIEKYPEIKPKLYENSIAFSSGYVWIWESPEEIIRKYEEIESKMYDLEEMHTQLMNRLSWEEGLTEKEKKEELQHYISDMNFIHGKYIFPDVICVPKNNIDEILRDYPKLNNKIYGLASIEEEGYLYPEEVVNIIKEGKEEMEERIEKLEKWINEARCELSLYEMEEKDE